MGWAECHSAVSSKTIWGENVQTQKQDLKGIYRKSLQQGTSLDANQDVCIRRSDGLVTVCTLVQNKIGGPVESFYGLHPDECQILIKISSIFTPSASFPQKSISGTVRLLLWPKLAGYYYILGYFTLRILHKSKQCPFDHWGCMLAPSGALYWFT